MVTVLSVVNPSMVSSPVCDKTVTVITVLSVVNPSIVNSLVCGKTCYGNHSPVCSKSLYS